MKYNVGDRVRIKSIDWYNENKDNYGSIYAGNGFCFWKSMARLCGEIMKITSVKVDPEDSNKGYYFMENSEEKWTDEMIEGLVEEETKSKYEDEVTGEYYSTPKYLVRPNGYQFVDENGNIINATKIVLEKKKKEYPKTYEECAKVLCECAIMTHGYKRDLLNALQKLIVCRDAYWKIAGEEMGLGKPWEPDWENPDHDSYPTITRCCGKIIRTTIYTHDCPFAFPTPEMRDAFYENFKELIEQCKELL